MFLASFTNEDVFLWTMHFYVIFEMIFAMKGAVTDCTTKRFAIRMNESMPDQFEFRGKYLLAVVTLKRR